MSHVTKIDIQIRDLDALQSAVEELGGQLIRNVSTYKWFGKHVGDYPLPLGIRKEDLGKCSHVIRVPGVEYEIGVVKSADGKSFTLLFDFWGPGQGLQKVFCGQIPNPHAQTHPHLAGTTVLSTGLEKLKQMYGIHAASRAAKAKGYTVQRLQVGGTIKLQIQT